MVRVFGKKKENASREPGFKKKKKNEYWDLGIWGSGPVAEAVSPDPRLLPPLPGRGKTGRATAYLNSLESGTGFRTSPPIHPSVLEKP